MLKISERIQWDDVARLGECGLGKLLEGRQNYQVIQAKMLWSSETFIISSRKPDERLLSFSVEHGHVEAKYAH